jgi:glycosyltransferase involved in cell wall biosynthesis
MSTEGQIEAGSKSAPLVSIITPVYNGAAFLAETLDSICSSTYANIELIVVDDGSTDGSADVARVVLETCGRPFQVISKPNSGEADSDNFGLARSSGEFVAFINADDPIEPLLIERSVEVFQQHPNVIVTYPDWKMIDENGEFIQFVKPKVPSAAVIVGDVQCLPGPGALIRRDAIKTPEIRKKQYRYVSDFEQWLSLLLEGDFVKIPEVLASWRRHSSQQTAAAQGVALAQELVDLIYDYFNRDGLPRHIRKLETQAKSQAHYQAAIQSLYGVGVPGKKHLVKSIALTYRRDSSSEAERRNPLVMLLVLANPLGRYYVKNHLRIKAKFRKARG